MLYTKKIGKAALLLGVLAFTWSCDSGEKRKNERKESPKKVADVSQDVKKTEIQKTVIQKNEPEVKSENKKYNQNKEQPTKVKNSEMSNRPAEKHIKKAFCVLNPKSGSEVIGAVTFTEVEGGVRIIADVGGLKSGLHGFHIHEKGDCSAMDASSAGGHFNPTSKKHGGPDSVDRHVGDLGNLDANQNGLAHYDRVDTVITLNGPQSIIGKSIVVHADEDDLKTDPSGNSGARIACGEIVESEP